MTRLLTGLTARRMLNEGDEPFSPPSLTPFRAVIALLVAVDVGSALATLLALG